MSLPEKYKELLLAFSADLKGILRPEQEEDVKLVQKGLLLYRQGLVSKVRLEDDLLTASVQDVTRVNVELNLNFLQLSSCTCPAEEICRHELAAFFYMYAQVGSVTEWAEEWRQPIQEKKSAQKWGIQRAKDLLKSTGILKPDYDRWVTNFNESFQAIMNEQKSLKPYLVQELYQVYTRKLKAGAPVEQEWKHLYYLVGSIHSFRNLLHLSVELGHTEDAINRYYRELFFAIIDEIEEAVHRLSVHALPFAFDEFIEKLKDDCIYLITDDLDLEFERTHLYVILWTKLFKKRTWREAENKKLEQIYLERKTLPIIIGMIHHHILLKNDEQALRFLAILEEAAAPYMLFWLERFKTNKDWKRMGPFVEAFVATFKPYTKNLYDSYARMDFARWAIKAVATYCIENHKFELYEKALVNLLPYSYRIYDDFLFEMASYEKWGDLQALIGFDIGSISKEKIKVLQQEDPHVLLPLYHQSIQQHIDLKNRGNYREAVKLLKKLRTLYKKLKRQEDWLAFMDILLERTKRLRAFQEECERGKLINA